MFSSDLGKKLDKYHLLKHPFYQIYWNEGKLNREIIKDYAEQYYQHVKAFPRYISATHSICEDLEKRRILLENLQDEENKDGDHPKLWKNFAKALGADDKKIENAKLDWFTKDMIDNFFSQARKSYAEGLASLYTYERQIPEIAETKIQGLKKFYGVNSKEGLEFFEAHKSADVIHRAECEKLLDSLSKDEQKQAKDAQKAAQEKMKSAKAEKKQLAAEPITEGAHYTYGLGDIVKNKNKSCPHYGSMGVVSKILDLPDMIGKLVTYRVTNNGPTYKAGDVLTKTGDQLTGVQYDD